MNEVHVRAETRDDEKRVHEVEVAAFEGTLQAEIVEVLRASAEPLLSLVATRDDRVVGHVCFSPATLDAAPELSAAQLSPIAVDPPYQGMGIGSALIREGLTRCDDVGWELVFLLGDPRYYTRFGFVLARPLGFTYGDPLADAGLHVFEVRMGALLGKGGRVRFHPAFALAESNP